LFKVQVTQIYVLSPSDCAVVDFVLSPNDCCFKSK
jgi:hypothetical protein